MANIKALPTVFAGCQFRSALEARWAVFFQTQGVTWNYEPETFRLAAGPYIPDFHLSWSSGSTVWAEVKPGMWDVTEYDAARHLEFATDGRTLLLLDGTPEPRAYACVGSGYSVTLQHWGPDTGPSENARLVAACKKAATTRFRR